MQVLQQLAAAQARAVATGHGAGARPTQGMACMHAPIAEALRAGQPVRWLARSMALGTARCWAPTVCRGSAAQHSAGTAQHSLPQPQARLQLAQVVQHPVMPRIVGVDGVGADGARGAVIPVPAGHAVLRVPCPAQRAGLSCSLMGEGGLVPAATHRLLAAELRVALAGVGPALVRCRPRSARRRSAHQPGGRSLVGLTEAVQPAQHPKNRGAQREAGLVGSGGHQGGAPILIVQERAPRASLHRVTRRACAGLLWDESLQGSHFVSETKLRGVPGQSAAPAPALAMAGRLDCVRRLAPVAPSYRWTLMPVAA